MSAEASTFVISLTPYTKDGALDERGLRGHLRRLAAAGIGVYLGGSGSGEGYTLTEAERDRVFEIGCEAFSAANDTEVRVAVLENEALRVAVMPTGGKIWSIYDKKRRRQLLYNPPALQLGQNAYRPWGPGGMEWNWSPGVSAATLGLD